MYVQKKKHLKKCLIFFANIQLKFNSYVVTQEKHFFLTMGLWEVTRYIFKTGTLNVIFASLTT